MRVGERRPSVCLHLPGGLACLAPSVPFLSAGVSLLHRWHRTVGGGSSKQEGAYGTERDNGCQTTATTTTSAAAHRQRG